MQSIDALNDNAGMPIDQLMQQLTAMGQSMQVPPGGGPGAYMTAGAAPPTSPDWASALMHMIGGLGAPQPAMLPFLTAHGAGGPSLPFMAAHGGPPWTGSAGYMPPSFADASVGHSTPTYDAPSSVPSQVAPTGKSAAAFKGKPGAGGSAGVRSTSAGGGIVPPGAIDPSSWGAAFDPILAQIQARPFQDMPLPGDPMANHMQALAAMGLSHIGAFLQGQPQLGGEATNIIHHGMDSYNAAQRGNASAKNTFETEKSRDLANVGAQKASAIQEGQKAASDQKLHIWEQQVLDARNKFDQEHEDYRNAMRIAAAHKDAQTQADAATVSAAMNKIDMMSADLRRRLDSGEFNSVGDIKAMGPGIDTKTGQPKPADMSINEWMHMLNNNTVMIHDPTMRKMVKDYAQEQLQKPGNDYFSPGPTAQRVAARKTAEQVHAAQGDAAGTAMRIGAKAAGVPTP